MSAVGRPRPVVVEARAKVNLGLAVGPRRGDGFHELATFFQSVSLADTLVVTPRPRGFTLRVRFEPAAVRGAPPAAGVAAVPAGDDNLVLRAARLLATRRALRGGAAFSLVKRIPARAGLGGGSADAAAALAGLAAAYGVRLSRGERVALAAELGSDVPFAITGGTALGRGRGERLDRVRLARPFRMVIAVPEWGVDTARAFRALDRIRKHLTQWGANLRSAQILGRTGLLAHRALRLGNTFETALGRRRGTFDRLKRRLEDAGATDVHLTGSGSAVVGLLPDGHAGAEVVRRFQGTEALYVVRSRGHGLKLIGRS